MFVFIKLNGSIFLLKSNKKKNPKKNLNNFNYMVNIIYLKFKSNTIKHIS